jgi:hypothetical protein
MCAFLKEKKLGVVLEKHAELRNNKAMSVTHKRTTMLATQ